MSNQLEFFGIVRNQVDVSRFWEFELIVKKYFKVARKLCSFRYCEIQDWTSCKSHTLLIDGSSLMWAAAGGSKSRGLLSRVLAPFWIPVWGAVQWACWLRAHRNPGFFPNLQTIVLLKLGILLTDGNRGYLTYQGWASLGSLVEEKIVLSCCYVTLRLHDLKLVIH